MKKKSRTKNSLINIVFSLLVNTISLVIGFISQAIFIKTLGNEYLGLNGVFSNIISMLSIVELGIGSAIIYNLYKPIANDDYETIKSLMKFYKKSYHIIGFIVLLIGLFLIPFINNLIGDVTLKINIYIIYLLFLSDSVLSYFLSYKRSILYANQKNYYIQIIHIIYLVVLNVLQIIFLLVTKNFYIYLIIKVIMRLLENILISIIANKEYSFLKDKNIKPLNKSIQSDIFKKVKALILHQISSFIISGTDNLIITRYLGLIQVGLYSNYYLIIKSIQTITKQVTDATAPSVGNLLITESTEKQFDVFKKMRFINFWIATFCSICLYQIMEPFITIWIGKEYILPNVVLLVLTINFYQKNMRNTYLTFKSTAGIFYEDRYIPIIESILNIVISIFLVKRIGLVGVFIGTIISGLSLWLYSYPICVYKKLFKRKYIDYLKETGGYIFIFIVTLFLTNRICNLIEFTNNTFMLISERILTCLIIPNIILFILFHKSDKFIYIKELTKRIIKRMRRKKYAK